MPKLRELEAEFVCHVPEDSLRFQGDRAEGAQGIMFRCPRPDHGHMILVWFANPLNAPQAPAHIRPTPRWQRIGETLDALTLAPSINSNDDWHGFIVNGSAQ